MFLRENIQYLSLSQTFNISDLLETMFDPSGVPMDKQSCSVKKKCHQFYFFRMQKENKKGKDQYFLTSICNIFEVFGTIPAVLHTHGKQSCRRETKKIPPLYIYSSSAKNRKENERYFLAKTCTIVTPINTTCPANVVFIDASNRERAV